MQRLEPGRASYLVVARGAATVNGVALDTRDGAAIRDEASLTIVATTACELVLVDTAA